MKKFLIICLTLFLTGPLFADGWTMPWDEPWTMPWDVSQDIRTDRVDVLLGVEIMPPDELAVRCDERDSLLRGCITDPDPCCSWVFLPGELASKHVLLFAVQHATYEILDIKCGAAEPCFEDNIL